MTLVIIQEILEVAAESTEYVGGNARIWIAG